MGRIETRFAELHGRGRKAFVAYITAGDPSRAATVTLVKQLAEAGADIVELGVPFSDPVADGPVNQQAAYRALQSGISVGDILQDVREIRKECTVPIIFFTYLNTLLAYGMERFATDAAESGLDGVLVLDLPPEEAGEYKRLMDGHNLATIFLVSPVTPVGRIDTIVNMTSGFVYYVSQMGVTGERTAVAADIAGHIKEIRSRTIVPVVVGFGISTPEQVRDAAEFADGVVVGSAIVKRIAGWGNRPGFENDVAAFVRTLTEPLQGE